MSGEAPLVEIVGLRKQHQALRPLRIAELRVPAGGIVSVSGLDAPAAEVLVNLMTAASRPDDGTVRLFGQGTEAIEDYEGWLAMLDGLGLVTDRAVLLGPCTVAQNVALPLTLQIDPIRDEVRPQVIALAEEAGIPAAALDTLVRDADPLLVQRVRLARALALGPRLLVAEHPTASLPRDAAAPFARHLAAVAVRRRLGLLAISMDHEFVRALGGTALTLDPATGVLSRPGLFARLVGR